MVPNHPIPFHHLEEASKIAEAFLQYERYE
jgi:hypothetical protein